VLFLWYFARHKTSLSISFIEDLVTLDVITVTGNLSVKTTSVDEGGEEGPPDHSRRQATAGPR
jgi:hypothetical protein